MLCFVGRDPSMFMTWVVLFKAQLLNRLLMNLSNRTDECLKNAFKTRTFCCVIAFTQSQGILDRVKKLMTEYKFELQRTSVVCVHSFRIRAITWLGLLIVLIRAC